MHNILSHIKGMFFMFWENDVPVRGIQDEKYQNARKYFSFL